MFSTCLFFVPPLVPLYCLETGTPPGGLSYPPRPFECGVNEPRGLPSRGDTLFSVSNMPLFYTLSDLRERISHACATFVSVSARFSVILGTHQQSLKPIDLEYPSPRERPRGKHPVCFKIFKFRSIQKPLSLGAENCLSRLTLHFHPDFGKTWRNLNRAIISTNPLSLLYGSNS